MFANRRPYWPAIDNGTAFLTPNVKLALNGLFILLSISNLWPYISSATRPAPIDFNHMWAAGQAWATGMSPYGDAFYRAITSQPNLHAHDVAAPFFYPPNTILLLIPLGYLSQPEAMLIWGGLLLMTFLASSLLFARIARQLGWPFKPLTIFTAHTVAFGLFWQSYETIFFHNMMTPIIYLGVLLLLHGVLTRTSWLIIIGLVICLFKPQLGLPLWFVATINARTRTASITAAFLTGLAALIGLLPGGVLAPFVDFLANVAAYTTYPENNAINTSGAGLISYYAFNAQMSSFVMLTIALAIVMIMTIRKMPASDSPLLQRSFTPEDLTTLLIISLLPSLFFLPSHSNYFIFIALLVLLNLKNALLPVFILGLTILMQSYFLGESLIAAGVQFDRLQLVSILDTVGISLIILALLPFLYTFIPATSRSCEVRHDD